MRTVPATTVHVLNTATWTMPEGMFVQLGGDELVPASCPCYLIEHPDRLVLFDTGLSHELVEDPHGYGPDGAPQMAEFRSAIELEATPTEHLDRLGYEPTDVDAVVCSHLHTDHAGNVDEFPDAEVFVHRRELRYAWWPDPAQEAFYIDGDLRPLRNGDVDVTELGGRTDLFGDGSVEVVPTPGHTPGHLSLRVDLGSETVVLAADAANLHSGFEAGLVAPFSWSAAEGGDSIRTLKDDVRGKEATVVISHDLGDREIFGG